MDLRLNQNEKKRFSVKHGRLGVLRAFSQLFRPFSIRRLSVVVATYYREIRKLTSPAPPIVKLAQTELSDLHNENSLGYLKPNVTNKKGP
ncbi:hypothetical protein WA026_001374 [Henosepilachna vigintioctopunctata]|uniref:Uncharacterized protein n=1 Tax=Henosepilachna vigintioctopunctata TaxID=420089 RepID=A0AAW1UKC2_9CUCU